MATFDGYISHIQLERLTKSYRYRQSLLCPLVLVHTCTWGLLKALASLWHIGGPVAVYMSHTGPVEAVDKLDNGRIVLTKQEICH